MEEVKLSDSQRRSLQTSFMLFEKSLRSVERMLSDGNKIGILYQQTINLDEETCLNIKNKIASTLMELEEFTDKLGLEKIEENVENAIMAEMSISWETILECNSKRMRGYGELNLDAIKIIDPAVNHFADIALGLCNLSSTKTEENSLND